MMEKGSDLESLNPCSTLDVLCDAAYVTLPLWTPAENLTASYQSD
jgi:hypothetical protein